MPINDIVLSYNAHKNCLDDMYKNKKQYMPALSDLARSIGLELGNPYSTGSGYLKAKRYYGDAYH